MWFQTKTYNIFVSDTFLDMIRPLRDLNNALSTAMKLYANLNEIGLLDMWFQTKQWKKVFVPGPYWWGAPLTINKYCTVIDRQWTSVAHLSKVNSLDTVLNQKRKRTFLSLDHPSVHV